MLAHWQTGCLSAGLLMARWYHYGSFVLAFRAMDVPPDDKS